MDEVIETLHPVHGMEGVDVPGSDGVHAHVHGLGALRVSGCW
jgi:hypothetical protein